MNKQPGGAKAVGIVIAAALFVVIVLLSAFLATTRGGTRDAITLPGQAAAPDQSPAVDTPDQVFANVNRENVQKILARMERPEAYYQSLTVTTIWSGGSQNKTIELWHSGSMTKARVATMSRTQYLLTNGRDVWLWYEGDKKALILQPDSGISFDDVVGIPTYEDLTQADTKKITEADFVALDDEEARNCLYVAVQNGEPGNEDHYWVDVDTQLICRADALEQDAQVYQLRQTSKKVLTPEDASLQSAFLLPDGTAAPAIAE